ncbi:hypothetical protein [Acetobacter oeni]|uniref:Uncharacterized protein n=1 Tax=Acetobacter oeni TaxID=304077 RepID=A0A511XHY2_9PROT|nr:hypothetical protein [Acetobacter oeni]MBB3882982.1 hypothetical protein [Acetobacter oeni]NHO19061.1 hypothetical protein [Acetobacter oeni]GBR04979.1 hypothetical protein AA21952_1591 [Acetobacter oeni LMG 21952]GEN62566.1 hypothetical protein AOE01nite_07900 [Acetobacter oeni]
MNDVFQKTDTGSIFLFPEKSLLNREDAARELGISNRMMLALIALRCGPPSLKIRSKVVWRREDLYLFRQTWMATVHVDDRDRTARFSAARPDHSDDMDPLMRVLGQRAIRHRIVLSVFWTMGITGGLMSLLLF